MNISIYWQRGADNLIHAIVVNYCGQKCKYIFNDFAFNDFITEHKMFYIVQLQEVNPNDITL